jgi:hypothetical protein
MSVDELCYSELSVHTIGFVCGLSVYGGIQVFGVSLVKEYLNAISLIIIAYPTFY